MRVKAYSLEVCGPSDTSGIEALLNAKAFSAKDVVCILGKTEGNGGRNDFTRELAMSRLEQLFAPLLGCAPEQVQDHVIFSFSGGTEGIVTPHMLVLVREGAFLKDPRREKRLAVAIGYTREFEPSEIGKMAQIIETASAIQKIVSEMQLESMQDIHLIQMKGATPDSTHEAMRIAHENGTSLTCDMSFSRAASALGAALALKEIRMEDLSDKVVNRDFSLYSSVASCSAKPGLVRTEILIFANSRYWEGDLVIAHSVLKDILDVKGILQVASQVGVAVEYSSKQECAAQLVGVFAKSEADSRGLIRGRRHTMLSDDDISDTRYSRCVLSSVLAAVLGETRVYVSTRAEHHGPLGGGPLAILARVGFHDENKQSSSASCVT